MNHTVACLQAEIAYLAYTTKWPMLCHSCMGSGVVDASDLSVGLVCDEDCPQCFYKGRCPRCAMATWTFTALDDSSTFACSSCGWKRGMEGAPYWECSCWEQRLDWDTIHSVEVKYLSREEMC